MCASLLCSPLALAQIGLPEYVPLKINQTVDAVYPSSMVVAGLKSGVATSSVPMPKTSRNRRSN